MFLFIFETIGAQELILIAAVALIIFGPRKLPQIAKTIGKTMAEFRNATSEFKSTWEKEVAFEDENYFGEDKKTSFTENSIARENQNGEVHTITPALNSPPVPEVKELSSEDVARLFQNKENQITEAPEEETKTERPMSSAKRDWL